MVEVCRKTKKKEGMNPSFNLLDNYENRNGSQGFHIFTMTGRGFLLTQEISQRGYNNVTLVILGLQI